MRRSVHPRPPWDLGPNTTEWAYIAFSPSLFIRVVIYFFWRLWSRLLFMWQTPRGYPTLGVKTTGKWIQAHFADKPVGSYDVLPGSLQNVPFHLFCMKKETYNMTLMLTYDTLTEKQEVKQVIEGSRRVKLKLIEFKHKYDSCGTKTICYCLYTTATVICND